MTTYAMICGINYYNTPNELRGCINDMLDMRSLLLKSGVEEKNLTILSDAPDRTDVTPTKANILANLTRVGKLAKAGDTLIFHYSGHGTYSRDKDSDEADKRDEAIYTADEDIISDDEFYSILRKLPKEVKAFVIMDCCHSASILDLKEGLDKKESNRATNNQHGYVVAISGCQDNQTSADAFLPASKAAMVDKQVNNREIVQQVRSRGVEQMRYRGALTAAFMDTVNKRKGLQAILDICFSNSKALMLSLRKDLLSWLQANRFTQVPNIAYEGAPPRSLAATREPLVHGLRIGGYNLRNTDARKEQKHYVPTTDLVQHRARHR